MHVLDCDIQFSMLFSYSFVKHNSVCGFAGDDKLHTDVQYVTSVQELSLPAKTQTPFSFTKTAPFTALALLNEVPEKTKIRVQIATFPPLRSAKHDAASSSKAYASYMPQPGTAFCIRRGGSQLNSS